MTRLLLPIACIVAVPAFAQDQQADNAASQDTEGMFQTLVDQCDDVDASMLRARIRLQIPRTTEEAGPKRKKMLEDAFGTCGDGDLDGAKPMLIEALAIAESGTDEPFGTSGTAETEATATEAETSDPAAEEDGPPPVEILVRLAPLQSAVRRPALPRLRITAM